MNHQTVSLISSVWYGDSKIELNFPNKWDVEVIGSNIPNIDGKSIRKKINSPIGTPKLSTLAKNKRRIVIIIDDITRPTPSSIIIPHILKELKSAGISIEYITIVVASGTHKPATKEEIRKKLGKKIYSTIKVIPHNCRENLVYIGKSKRGTPIFINKAVYEADLKIGIGCIFPHPAAGFSGGAKIIVPGVVGLETATYLHDYFNGAIKRGKSIKTDFRKELGEITKKVGIDFIVNVVLNHRREIARLFAGDKKLVLEKGVEFVKENYQIPIIKNADVVIADTYPFDINLNLARDRGFWPIYNEYKNTTKVVLAACPMGLGEHELFPTTNSLRKRILRRIKNFNLDEIKNITMKIKSIKNIIRRKNLNFMLLSEGINESELNKCFPKASVYKTWDGILSVLQKRYQKHRVNVVIFRCAPLYLPNN